MASDDVVFRALIQTVLSTTAETIYTVATVYQGLAWTVFACNILSGSQGYDLQLAPSGVSFADKHFLRASKTADAGDVAGGNTEMWDIAWSPDAGNVFRGACDTASAVALTLSVADREK